MHEVEWEKFKRTPNAHLDRYSYVVFSDWFHQSIFADWCDYNGFEYQTYIKATTVHDCCFRYVCRYQSERLWRTKHDAVDTCLEHGISTRCTILTRRVIVRRTGLPELEDDEVLAWIARQHN